MPSKSSLLEAKRTWKRRERGQFLGVFLWSAAVGGLLTFGKGENRATALRSAPSTTGARSITCGVTRAVSPDTTTSRAAGRSAVRAMPQTGTEAQSIPHSATGMASGHMSGLSGKGCILCCAGPSTTGRVSRFRGPRLECGQNTTGGGGGLGSRRRGCATAHRLARCGLSDT